MNTKNQKVKLTSNKNSLAGIICEPDNYFGQALRELRLRKNLTQENAAKLLSTSQAQWSAYELGKNKPNLDTIIAISIALKVHPFEIINLAFKHSSLLSNEKFTNDIIRRQRNKRENVLSL